MKQLYIKLIIVVLFSALQSAIGQTSKKVDIYWDVSHSMVNRNLEKEFYFLDAYFKDALDANVVLLTFSNQVISKDEFKVVDGDWLGIKEKLKSVDYDGGTFFAPLEDYAQGGDILLFTDGKQTLGATTPNFDGELHVINGKKDFDRASLNLLAIVNNGNLVNLTENRSIKNQSNTQVYSGNIYKGTTGLPNAEVYIKGNRSEFLKSDTSGAFKINAVVGDTLVISYRNNEKVEVLGDDLSIDFSFEDRGIQLDEVVVTDNVKVQTGETTTGYGKESKEKLGYAVQSITDKDITDIATTGNNAIQGKFSGVKLGQNDDLSQITMRPSNSILGNNYGLIVIDGIPTSRANSGSVGLADAAPERGNDTAAPSRITGTGFIDPQNIAEITVLKGLAATNRFGSMGANGVLLITTKTAQVAGPKGEKRDLARLTNNVYDGKIKVSNKALVTPYLKELKKGKNVQEAYDMYLKQRNKYANTPEYYLDVYAFFYSSNNEIAERILTNILEKEQPSYDELRGMFLKTTENGNHNMALSAANRMLEQFPNKIQPYFDVAMANKNVGNHQEALNMFNRIVNGSANEQLNFGGIEKVVGTEIRNLVNKERAHLDLSKVDQKYRNNLTYNARLFLDWNNADAEFVVQVVNPQKRFFNWEHTETADRARILNELQHGFSNEQFEIVGAETIGDWILNVTYLGNRTSGSKTPTFLKCTVQYNFGKPNQKSEEFMVRLQEPGDEQQLAKFTVQ
ncbi:TonB-dependent receptor plug domain-containing protein [Flagellimonas sp. S3867]|uniref:TonB-dependent receptor plug domain-containing protein n=1 Tax=Flagellimonas sp. S3867 TaxID=2768063 RepID=UPI001684FCCB|nr:TonB-dependent receptor plug domain-containing protein [Flagellimonas sp. S3867]